MLSKKLMQTARPLMSRNTAGVRRMGGHGIPKWNEAAYRKQNLKKERAKIVELLPWYANPEKYWAEYSVVAVLMVIPITMFVPMTEGFIFGFQH